ncbi:MAG: hypothetical protein U1C55_10635 [Smithellaceae bacterium]|nr:hypothetical protein [Smithellaceae bacterium]
MIRATNIKEIMDIIPRSDDYLSKPPLRIGEVLVQMGCVSENHVQYALEKQKSSGAQKKIGDILIEEGYVTKRHVREALKLQSLLVTAALIAAFLVNQIVGMTPAAQASSKAKSMEITTRVLPHWKLSVEYQAQEIVITEEDIRKGVVEVKAGTRLTIKNTSKAGYYLLFEGLGKPFKSLSLQGINGLGEVIITSPNALVHQEYSKTARTHELSYKFYLSDDVKPGTYPWPVLITLQPS